jgi:hypothetical protein
MMHRRPVEIGGLSRRPCFLEGDAADLCQDVDPPRWKADLAHDPGGREVVSRNTRCLDGRAEAQQRSPHAARVLTSGPHEEVEVTGESWHAVQSKRVRSNDDELDPLRPERRQQIPEVRIEVAQLRHSSPRLSPGR